MNNLFQNQSGLGMHRKYDLKGSTQARFAAESSSCLPVHGLAEKLSRMGRLVVGLGCVVPPAAVPRLRW